MFISSARWPNHVVHVNAGQLTHYPGGYQYYLDKTKATSARAALTAGGRMRCHVDQPSEKSSAPKRGSQRAKASGSRATPGPFQSPQGTAASRASIWKREFKNWKSAKAEITAELEKPETYQAGGKTMELNREFRHNADDIAELTPNGKPPPRNWKRSNPPNPI